MILVQHLSQFLLSAYFALGLILTSLLGVIFIVTTTSPIELGPAGMLTAFGGFYLWFLALLLGVAHIIRAMTSRGASEEERQRTITSRAVMLAAAWAFAPLIMLALQSIGQLDIVSVGLVLVFEVLATVYIVRR